MNTESAEPDEEEKQDASAQEFVAELVDEVNGAESVEDVVADVLNAEPAIATATAAPAVAYSPSILSPPKPASYQQPPSPMANLSAKGGAVGAVVLGVLSFGGSFVTSYAIINSIIGVTLGLWGLRSDHRRMALLGMLLCLISAFFCVLDISEWLQSLWPDPDLE